MNIGSFPVSKIPDNDDHHPTHKLTPTHHLHSPKHHGPIHGSLLLSTHPLTSQREQNPKHQGAQRSTSNKHDLLDKTRLVVLRVTANTKKQKDDDGHDQATPTTITIILDGNTSASCTIIVIILSDEALW
jgi:hypothetical protein